MFGKYGDGRTKEGKAIKSIPLLIFLGVLLWVADYFELLN